MNIDQELLSLKCDRHLLKMRLNFNYNMSVSETEQLYKQNSEIATQIEKLNKVKDRSTKINKILKRF